MKNFFYIFCILFPTLSFAEKFECQIESSSIIEEKSSIFGSGGYTFKTNGKEEKKIYYFFEDKESYYSVDGERYSLVNIGNNYFIEKTPSGNLNFIKAIKNSKGKFVTVSKSFSIVDTLMVSNILFKCQ